VIAGGFIALELLRFEAQSLGELGLGVATRNAGFDEEVGQFTQRMQFER
jgi:hypothetical protein